MGSATFGKLSDQQGTLIEVLQFFWHCGIADFGCFVLLNSLSSLHEHLERDETTSRLVTVCLSHQQEPYTQKLHRQISSISPSSTPEPKNLHI